MEIWSRKEKRRKERWLVRKGSASQKEVEALKEMSTPMWGDNCIDTPPSPDPSDVASSRRHCRRMFRNSLGKRLAGQHRAKRWVQARVRLRLHQGQKPEEICTNLGAESEFPIRQRVGSMTQFDGTPLGENGFHWCRDWKMNVFWGNF